MVYGYMDMHKNEMLIGITVIGIIQTSLGQAIMSSSS